MKIDIWSDIACPWCYIGLTRFERALAEFPHRDEVKVTVHSFQLDPSLPDSYPGTEAEYLSGRKGISVPEVEAMFEHVAAAAASEGLTMRFDTLAVANSRRAHRVLHAAAAADPSGATQRRLEDSLFRAHFTDGESIADPDVLVRLATTAGMNAAEAAAAVDDETRDAEVAADITRAAQLGISGVPFFVLDERYGISGAQPREVFDQALTRVWDELHPRIEPLKVPGLEGFSGGPACGPDGC